MLGVTQSHADSFSRGMVSSTTNLTGWLTSVSQEVGGTLIGEDGIVIMAGAE